MAYPGRWLLKLGIYNNPNTDVVQPSKIHGFAMTIKSERKSLHQDLRRYVKKKIGSEMEHHISRKSNNSTTSASSIVETPASLLTYLALYVKPSIDDIFSWQYCFLGGQQTRRVLSSGGDDLRFNN